MLPTGSRAVADQRTDFMSDVFLLGAGFLFRFTIIWESMIVIIREKRAEVIEIIWERVEPRAA